VKHSDIYSPLALSSSGGFCLLISIHISHILSFSHTHTHTHTHTPLSLSPSLPCGVCPACLWCCVCVCVCVVWLSPLASCFLLTGSERAMSVCVLCWRERERERERERGRQKESV